MERKITLELLKWKKDILRKPLLLYGCKQVGKTYSVIEFGTTEYKNMVYFNTTNNKELIDIFKKEKTIDKIILKLSLLAGESIFPNDTLIVFDNVNDLEIAKGVKLFGKEKNDYHIIMITSLRENLIKFKGEELQYRGMAQLDFEEYLMALGKKELIEYIKESFGNNKPMAFHSVALDLYYDYLITGGYPEVVEAVINKKNDFYISAIKQKIVDTLKKEFNNMANLIDIVRNNEIFSSIPYQLLKENRKFQYGLIKTGSRSKNYDVAIDYLTANGFVNKSYRITEAKSPLTSCRDKESFKLYLNDSGLLYMLLHASKAKFMTDDNIKNILIENNLANTLSNNGYGLCYYQSEGKAELSFVIQNRMGKIIPIEIVDKNLSKAKSLTLFMNKFTVGEAIRITEDNFAKKKNIKYLPVYAIFCLKDL